MTKSIIISETNKAKIDELIKIAQKGCSVRTITFSEIQKSLLSLQDRLAITKKALEGTMVIIDINYSTFPNAYKGIPQSTAFRATFIKGNWKLIEVYRARTQSKEFTVLLSESAKSAILEGYRNF